MRGSANPSGRMAASYRHAAAIRPETPCTIRATVNTRSDAPSWLAVASTAVKWVARGLDVAGEHDCKGSRRGRDEHLAAVTCGRDSRCPVHVDADVALLAQERGAGVDAHPHSNRAGAERFSCVACRR